MSIEVTAFSPEVEIGGKGGHANNTLGEGTQFVRGQQHPGKRQTGNHYRKEGWQDTSCPTLIESSQTEAPGLLLTQNDGGNQIAADNKKNIYANVSTAEDRQTGMKKNDRHHSNRPEAINLSSIRQQCLFHRYRFSKVARLIHIGTTHHSDVIAE